MEENNPRLKALNLLKLSSIAFIESREKHGEAGAVAACSRTLNKYDEFRTSKEFRAVAPPKLKVKPKSNLNTLDIDQILAAPCAGKYEQCKQKEVTDEDVKALMKKSKRNSNTSEGSSKAIDFDKEFQSFFDSAALDDNQLHNMGMNFQQKPSSTKLQKSSTDSTDQRRNSLYSPPRKVPALAANQQRKPDLITRINNSFRKQPSSTGPSSSSQQPERHSQQPERHKQAPHVPAPIPTNPYPDFNSARRELQIQNAKRYGSSSTVVSNRAPSGYHPVKSLGGKRINAPFKVPTLVNNQTDQMEVEHEVENPLLAGIDPVILETIKREVISNTKDVQWEDIAGLEAAKETIHEAVVLPLVRPEMFRGLLKVPKGILLFGPPGTGKTLIGKCIASHSQATFFSISASTLTSKWVGQGEKLVKALFLYARVMQPSVIFIDEIDSILTKRSESEHESSRRLKTEFLVQFDGAYTTEESDRLLMVGATNRPQELDDAARRRFTKRLYIPLPEFEARRYLLNELLKQNKNSLTPNEIDEIAGSTDGYSGADIKTLCSEAAHYAIRELTASQVMHINLDEIRPINVEDLRKSLTRVKASVSQDDLEEYVQWNKKFGSTM